MRKDPKKVLEEMSQSLAEELLRRVNSGEATAAELSVARNFLRDHKIECGNPSRNRTLQQLTELLPFDDNSSEEAENN